MAGKEQAHKLSPAPRQLACIHCWCSRRHSHGSYVDVHAFCHRGQQHTEAPDYDKSSGWADVTAARMQHPTPQHTQLALHASDLTVPWHGENMSLFPTRRKRKYNKDSLRSQQVAQHFQQSTPHFAIKTVAEKGLYLKGLTVSELIDLFGAPWLEKNSLYVETEILRLVEQCTSMNDAQLRNFDDNCTAIARDEISQLTGWALRDCCHARTMDGITPLISCNCHEIIPETPPLTPAEESHAGIVQTYVGVLIPTCLHADVFSRQQPYEHLQQCSCTYICTLCHAV